MTTLIIGGTGFIGRRLVPLLAQRGEEIVCMDINPATAVLRATSASRSASCAAMSASSTTSCRRWSAAKPERVINLAYYLGSEYPPHVAFKLNILGMDNCFEAARLAGVNRVAYASSLAVSGEQHFTATGS